MILINLKLKNFKKYKSANFEFKTGLSAIIGKNGSGKSTILQALIFALFGVLPNTKKEFIKNSNANPNDEVLISLEFLLINQIYKVQRSFKGRAQKAYSELFLNSELIVSGVNEVSNFLSNLLKIDKDGFLNTVFASQKELSNLSDLPITERKKLIRKFLGLEKIDKIQKKLKESIKDLNKELKICQNSTPDPKELSDLQESLKLLFESKKRVESEIYQLNFDQVSLKKEQNFLKSKLENLQILKEKNQKNISKICEINSNQQILNLQKLDLLAQINELDILQNETENLKNAKSDLKDCEDLLNEQNEFKNQINLKKSFESELIELKKEEQNLKQSAYLNFEDNLQKLQNQTLKTQNLKIKIDRKIEILQNKKQILQNKIFSKEENSQIAKEKLIKLQNLNEPICPTCLQKLGNNFKNVLENLKVIADENSVDLQSEKHILINQIQNLQNKKKRLDELEKELNQQFLKLQIAQNLALKDKQNLQDLQNKIFFKSQNLKNFENINFDENEFLKLQNKQKILKKDYEKFYEFSLKLQNKQVLQMKFDQISLEITKLQDELKKIESLKNEFCENEFLQTKIEFDLQSLNLQSLNQKLNESNIQIVKISKDIDFFEDKLKNAQFAKQKFEDLKQESLDNEKLNLIFLNFNDLLSAQIAPRISILASKILSEVTKGRYTKFEIDENFGFFIYDEGEKFPLTRFSGGEIDLANLILRVCLAQIMNELNGANKLSFLAFDEVLASFDDQRKEEVLEVFYTISKQYKQIFLISHDEALKDSFENIIEL